MRERAAAPRPRRAAPGLDRRTFLGGLGLTALVGGARPARARHPVPGWEAWRDRFLRPSGRVVDVEQERVSHSEGQAYGLLLAQAAGDLRAFAAIERWTAQHLDIRQDALMAWRWQPGQGVVGDDWHNATDGDLFRAWAHLRAERDSGWSVAPGRWQAIARDLSASCLWPDPRAPAELLLRPSAEARAGADRVLLNPSYIMPRALRELGAALPEARLIRAADHGETCLAELAALGMLPDWIGVAPQGYVPPLDHALRQGYDALRIPLYLVWSGRAVHPAVDLALSRLEGEAPGGAVVVARDADGTPTARSDLPGYRTLAHLTRCPPAEHPPQAASPYYPAVLHLLAAVARREGGVCPEPG